jgi:hypothetical protein
MLCDKHLLGEHVEHHMFIGTIARNISIKGYLEKGLLEPNTLYMRHAELVKEMIERGMNHKSILPKINIPNIKGKININCNIENLKNRCNKCKEKIELLQKK